MDVPTLARYLLSTASGSGQVVHLLQPPSILSKSITPSTAFRPRPYSTPGEQAAPGFVYTIKASKFLTHQKKLKDPVGPLELLLERARRLGPHLGPILYQLPPWHCDIERLRDFLAALPDGFRHVLEFRDPSWYTEEVHRLLTQASVGFCIHDMKGVPCPQWVTAPFAYLRFHGPTNTAYVGRYEHDQFAPGQMKSSGIAVKAWTSTLASNNDPEGSAIANARGAVPTCSASAGSGGVMTDL